MFKSLNRTKPAKIILDSKDILPLCFVGLTAFSCLSFLLILFVGFKVNQLAARKTTFVQMIDGKTVLVSEQDYLYRQPEVIREVVRQWVDLTFNWDGVIPGTKELDKGRNIGNGKRVTTNAYFGSFLIQPGPQGFRQAALQSLAEITPSRVFSGQVRSKMVISYLSAPRQTRIGEWEVDMVATRVLVNLPGGADEEIPFNRTITLQAVDIPSPPTSDASALEQQLYQIRKAGLEITKITEFTPN
ncbi:hypothetical protein IQ264_28780 [Phormidium sp. LEGE 05292]|uniref:hypothetical protein n=1 Tax=[Phormidium] sp. LEGE 05292 TaxID=767427 RepID=UPI001882EA04|nr:hypothetical protein [Phormidium sp. LEGE 05292]MBE9229405.1 hypothetical protein [Phormidium sp. LEGE 05292]